MAETEEPKQAPVVATYLARITLRENTDKVEPPTLQELELDITDGIEGTFGWERNNINVSAERVDI